MKMHLFADVNLKISVVTDGTKIPYYQLLRLGRGAIIGSEATTQDYVWTIANG